MLRIPFKPGSDFLLTCTYKIAGVLTPIAGLTFKSQIRDAQRNLVAELDFATTDDPATFTFSKSAAQTIAWPTGLLYADIRKVNDSGKVNYSKTYAIDSQVRQTDG